MRRSDGAADFFRDLFARAEARIEQSLRLEFLERLPVIGEVAGLATDGLLPAKTEPGEIGLDPVLELAPRARGVDVLDA